MSWQSKFDASGPSWNGNAAAVAEENRRQKEMDDRRSATKSHTIDQSQLNELDQIMDEPFTKEKTLLINKKNCTSENDRMDIEKEINKTRKLFHETKSKYMKLRNV